MELDWLEDFFTLADCKNFSRAAEQRHVTQPAFSRRIRALENWVGAALFKRDTHRIELTPAAERFRPYAEQAYRCLTGGREQARDTALSGDVTIHFAATHALSQLFFPDWLASIEALVGHGVCVKLDADNMAGCERMMLQGTSHFLLCHGHPAASTRLQNDQFLSVHLADDLLLPVCVPENGRPLFPLPGTADEPLPLLAYSEVSGIGRIVEASRAIDGPSAQLRPIFTSHLATALLAMARKGRGIAWVPLSLVGNDLEDGNLAAAGGPEWNISIEIRLVRPRARQSPAVEHVWSLITGLNKRPPAERRFEFVG